jgi:rRNA-processing protein EBP2
VHDDLTREQAFYKQCLEGAIEGRSRLKKEGVPFTRPNDFFAEMVKTDEQMGKIKSKMIEEAAGKKAAAEARKQRDLKKFGKAVQVAKQQERDKAKRETLDKINVLKRSECLQMRRDDEDANTSAQNERTAMLPIPTRKTSLTSPSTTRSKRKTSPAVAAKTQSQIRRGRRRTRNLATEARSVFRRVEMPNRLGT